MKFIFESFKRIINVLSYDNDLHFRQLIICLSDFLKYDDISWSLLGGMPNYAALNIQNNEGLTALMVGVINKVDKQFIRSIISLGADITLKDKNGNNVLHHAVRSGDSQILNIIIKPIEQIEIDLCKMFFGICISNRVEQIKYLIIALRTKNKDGNTPLKIALAQMDNDCYKVLMEIEKNLEEHEYTKMSMK